MAENEFLIKKILSELLIIGIIILSLIFDLPILFKLIGCLILLWYLLNRHLNKCTDQNTPNDQSKGTVTITLINKDKLMKECPVGFSLTTFFLGFWVPLTRGDLKWGAIMFLFSSFIYGLGSSIVITESDFYYISHLIGKMCIIFLIALIPSLIWGAKYNKLYIQTWLEKGYKPYDQRAKTILEFMGIRYGK